MNSACIIRCAAMDPHLFNDGGRIGGNEFRVRLDESLLAAALVICFAAKCGKALAHACNNNYCVNSSGHVVHSPSCGKEHEKRPCGMSAALAFRSITTGPARTTAAWRTGIDPASYGWRSFVAARLPDAGAPPAGASELSLSSDAFGYNPTHLVQLTSTTSP